MYTKLARHFRVTRVKFAQKIPFSESELFARRLSGMRFRHWHVLLCMAWPCLYGVFHVVYTGAGNWPVYFFLNMTSPLTVVWFLALRARLLHTQCRTLPWLLIVLCKLREVFFPYGDRDFAAILTMVWAFRNRLGIHAGFFGLCVCASGSKRGGAAAKGGGSFSLGSGSGRGFGGDVAGDHQVQGVELRRDEPDKVAV